MDGKDLYSANAAIGERLGHRPVIRWAVMNRDETALCFESDEPGQRGKSEADEWLADNVRRFPTGWVATGGYHVIPRMIWPDYLSESTTPVDSLIIHALKCMGKISIQGNTDGTIRITGENGASGIGSTLAVALAVALGVLSN